MAGYEDMHSICPDCSGCGHRGGWGCSMAGCDCN